jgi:hypothetical protein
LLLLFLPSAGDVASAAISTGGELNADEVMVDTFTELKTVLTDAAYDNIAVVYMNNNIEFESVGNFAIREAHPDMTFVGHPKGHPEIRYTLQDYYNTTNLRIGKDGRTVTLKDMNIRGYNYYGTISSRVSSNTTIIFDNVNYIGSQAAWNTNTNGTVVFKDTNVTIGTVPADPVNFPNPPSPNYIQEVVETVNLKFAGNCTFTNNGTSNSTLDSPGYRMFYLTGSQANSITIEPGANITITNNFNSTGADYGTAFQMVTPRPLIIGKDAVLKINVFNGIGPSSDGRFETIDIGEGATLDIVQSGDGHATHTVNVTNGMNVGRGATLNVSRAANTRNSNGLINIYSAGKSINFDSPARVNLYNPNKILFYAYPISAVNIGGSTGAINIWASGAAADSIDSPPTYMFNKADGLDLGFSASVTNHSTTATAQLTGFDSSSDFATGTFNPSSFDVKNMQRLTMGSYTLGMDTVHEQSAKITGTASAEADIRVSYKDSTDTDTVLDTAAGSGSWSVNVPARPLPLDGLVTAHGYKDFLNFKAKTVVQQDPGELTLFDVPAMLGFKTGKPPTAHSFVERDDADWTIVVKDSRPSRNPWELSASISAPLTAEVGGDTLTLPDALVFIDAQGQATPLSSSPLTVFSATTDSTGQTDVKWDSDKGPHLELYPGPIKSGVSYSTTITWTLTDAP